jgi:hypothetical protein
MLDVIDSVTNIACASHVGLAVGNVDVEVGVWCGMQ